VAQEGPLGAILFDPARCYGAPITIRLVGMPLAWHRAENIGAGNCEAPLSARLDQAVPLPR
jgi:hypothetical protein